MDLTQVTSMSKRLGRDISRNSPSILTAMGVAGLVSTVILAIKATPKALDILDQESKYRCEAMDDPRYGEPIEAIEAVELTWKEYIPTALMGATTIACMIGANHISLRRNAALVSLLSFTETTLREYQEKVKEQIGEKKAQKVEDEIIQDTLDKHPMNDKTVIITGHGVYPCFENFSKRYFKSDIEHIRKTENLFNQRLLREGWLSINEFYYELGLDPIELGDEIGWIAERAMLELKFNTKMVKDSGEPCLVVDYLNKPNHI